MIFTYPGLIAYGIYILMCLNWLCKIHPIVKMHEVNWSKKVLNVLGRIKSNSNRLEEKSENRFGIGEYLKSKDIYTFEQEPRNKCVNIYCGFGKDDNKLVALWLESDSLKKIHSRDDTVITWTKPATHNKRQQRGKYTDNDLHGFTKNWGVNYEDKVNSAVPRYRYGFNIHKKLKSSNQKNHRKKRNAKNSILTSEHPSELKDGDTFTSEDVEDPTKMLDARNISPESVGLTTYVSLLKDIFLQKLTSQIVETTKSISKISDATINGEKVYRMLSRIGPLDMWVEQNLQKIPESKLTKMIRFDLWPENAEFNTSTHNIRDITATSNTGVADSLRTQVRVLCWIMISTSRDPRLALPNRDIMKTWAKRCTKVLFMSTFSPSKREPIVKLNTTGANSTWGRTKEAIRYLYEYHLSDADWFLGTDEGTIRDIDKGKDGSEGTFGQRGTDSYVIMENLRYMLSGYNPKDPLYFGCRHKVPSAESFVTDITGYVLSREAVKRLGNFASVRCRRGNEGPAAVKLDKCLCLKKLAVEVIDTRDSVGLGRFFTYKPQDAMFPKKKKKFWFSFFMYYSLKEGKACCSDYAIMFHEGTTTRMHIMEYFVYHLRPYGVRFGPADKVADPLIEIPNQPKLKDSAPADVGANNKDRDRIYEDRSVADEMANEVRVLCWVMTYPANHKTQAVHVKETWGKRCNILLFMSTELDPALPTIALPVKEGYKYLWGKTREAFRYVYEHHRGDAHWFLKVDDDAYVVVENLRYMLSKYNTEDPIYFGLRYDFFEGFMAGGPGYVLSRAALDKFVTESLPDEDHCSPDRTNIEDLEMGHCLVNVGVKLMDSRDSMQRGRFFHSRLNEHYFPETNTNQWLVKHMYYGMPEGLKCCSKYAISFHYIKRVEMHVMEYIIYHLKPYGYLWNGTETEKYLSEKLDQGIEF